MEQTHCYNCGALVPWDQGHYSPYDWLACNQCATFLFSGGKRQPGEQRKGFHGPGNA